MTRAGFAIAVAVTTLLGSCGDGDDGSSKHVLVVGLDGVLVAGLQQASTPNIDALIADGAVSHDAFAGGTLGTATEQLTFSGPGWSSILTGVWIDKHGVRGNVFVDPRFDEYPHFFERIRERNPEAFLSSFVNWEPINDNIVPAGLANKVFASTSEDNAERDVEVTQAVVQHLENETPDVVFVHLDHVDYQGHAGGFSDEVPAYLQAIETVDSQVGQMVAAIRARPTYAVEQWLVVVTTDHGGIGRLHGGQTDEERRIFLIASGGDVEPGQVLSPGPGHTAVPPTVVRHLGISIDPAWGWADKPFGMD